MAGGAVPGLLEELNFWRLVPPAWAEERALFALVRVPLVHHAGHIFFWRHHPKSRAIVLRVPCSSAWRAHRGVVARLSAGAVGHVESFFFVDRERGQRRRWSGAESLA